VITASREQLITAAPLFGKSTLWYLSRSSGFVLLGLFTLTMVLGLLTAGRVASPRWPRFVTESLHRNVSLLSLVLLVVHVGAVVIDRYVKVDLLDVFVPFLSAYQPLWLGLGSLALDIMIMLALTSLLRVRFGFRTWRVLHWSAYACWPLALSHGVGVGTDRPYLLGFTVFCVITVALAAGYRLAGARRVALARPA
jgi:methionine sulfoxide reductase heme-binding subunit